VTRVVHGVDASASLGASAVDASAAVFASWAPASAIGALASPTLASTPLESEAAGVDEEHPATTSPTATPRGPVALTRRVYGPDD